MRQIYGYQDSGPLLRDPSLPLTNVILVSVISSLCSGGNLTSAGRLAALSYPWASKGEYVT
jgi:hypothetical protein